MVLPRISQTKQIREKSRTVLAERGLRVPDHFPLLDSRMRAREQDDIIARLLCLNAIAACSFGFNKTKAISWIDSEKLNPYLTSKEVGFLFGNVGEANEFQFQIEGIWALAWVLSLVDHLDFWQYCEDSLASRMPDLEAHEPSTKLRASAKRRQQVEVIAALDLAYCLHWAVRQAAIHGKPLSQLTDYVIIERRRALEWVESRDKWDAVFLDT